MIPNKYKWMRPDALVNRRGMNDKIGGYPFKMGHFWWVNLWKEKMVPCCELKRGHDLSALPSEEEQQAFQDMIKRRLRKLRCKCKTC